MKPFYRASHYGMKNSVGYFIRRTANLVLPRMEVLFAEDDLTFSQWTVLMALREWRESTSAELARNICHDAGSLTRILDELQQRGLIARARSETDRRVISLTLTPRGRTLVESLLPKVVAFWNGLLTDFSHAEIKLLLSLLTRLVAAAGGEDETGRQRRRQEKERAGENRPRQLRRVRTA